MHFFLLLPSSAFIGPLIHFFYSLFKKFFITAFFILRHSTFISIIFIMWCCSLLPEKLYWLISLFSFFPYLNIESLTLGITSFDILKSIGRHFSFNCNFFEFVYLYSFLNFLSLQIILEKINTLIFHLKS